MGSRALLLLATALVLGGCAAATSATSAPAARVKIASAIASAIADKYNACYDSADIGQCAGFRPRFGNQCNIVRDGECGAEALVEGGYIWHRSDVVPSFRRYVEQKIGYAPPYPGTLGSPTPYRYFVPTAAGKKHIIGAMHRNGWANWRLATASVVVRRLTYRPRSRSYRVTAQVFFAADRGVRRAMRGCTVYTCGVSGDESVREAIAHSGRMMTEYAWLDHGKWVTSTNEPTSNPVGYAIGSFFAGIGLVIVVIIVVIMGLAGAFKNDGSGGGSGPRIGFGDDL